VLTKGAVMSRRRRNLPPSGEDATSVNASFYSASPANYLGQRLLNLVARTAVPAVLDDALRDGVDLDGRRIDMKSFAPAAVAERFSTVESLILTYHAAESLLRLYFAHEHFNECPWAELVTMRNTDFWEALDLRFIRQTPIEALSRVERVFFGMDLPESLIQSQRPDGDVLNVELFLWRYARYVKEMKDIYNSAKHGLSLIAFNLGLKVEGPFPTQRDGRVVQSLAFGPVQGQRSEWHTNVAYVDLPENVARVDGACRLISQMWRVAQARYLKTPITRLESFSTPRIEELFSDEGSISSLRLGMPRSRTQGDSDRLSD
jgi:hypothetical protein